MLRGREGQPFGSHLDVGARSQIRDPAPKLGADEARVGRDDARSTNLSPKPLGGMLGRDLCRQGTNQHGYDAIKLVTVIVTHLSGALKVLLCAGKYLLDWEAGVLDPKYCTSIELQAVQGINLNTFRGCGSRISHASYGAHLCDAKGSP